MIPGVMSLWRTQRAFHIPGILDSVKSWKEKRIDTNRNPFSIRIYDSIVVYKGRVQERKKKEKDELPVSRSIFIHASH